MRDRPDLLLDWLQLALLLIAQGLGRRELMVVLVETCLCLCQIRRQGRVTWCRRRLRLVVITRFFVTTLDRLLDMSINGIVPWQWDRLLIESLLLALRLLLKRFDLMLLSRCERELSH